MEGPNHVKTRLNHVPTLRTPYLGNRTAIEQLCEKTAKKMPKKMPDFGNRKGWLIGQQKTQLLMRQPKKYHSFVDLSRGHTGHGFFSHESLCFGSTTHLSCTVYMQKSAIFTEKSWNFRCKISFHRMAQTNGWELWRRTWCKNNPALIPTNRAHRPSMMHFYRPGGTFC